MPQKTQVALLQIALQPEKSAIYSMNKDFLIGPRDLFHSVWSPFPFRYGWSAMRTRIYGEDRPRAPPH